MGIQYYAFAVVALAASGILQIFLEYLSYSNDLLNIVLSLYKLMMIIFRKNILFQHRQSSAIKGLTLLET